MSDQRFKACRSRPVTTCERVRNRVLVAWNPFHLDAFKLPRQSSGLLVDRKKALDALGFGQAQLLGQNAVVCMNQYMARLLFSQPLQRMNGGTRLGLVVAAGVREVVTEAIHLAVWCIDDAANAQLAGVGQGASVDENSPDWRVHGLELNRHGDQFPNSEITASTVSTAGFGCCVTRQASAMGRMSCGLRWRMAGSPRFQCNK